MGCHNYDTHLYNPYNYHHNYCADDNQQCGQGSKQWHLKRSVVLRHCKKNNKLGLPTKEVTQVSRKIGNRKVFQKL